MSKLWFLNLWITSFWTQTLHLNVEVVEKCWKDDVVTFTAHLSETIKRLTWYKQKVVVAALLEGKSMPSNMAANTNRTILLKNQSAIKHLP